MPDLNPVAPGADESVEVQPTEAEIQEQKEWDDALEEYAPGLSKTKAEENSDEPPVTTTTTTTIAPTEEEAPVTTTTTTTLDPNETPEQKAAREASENAANDAAASDDGEGEAGPADGTRTARQTQREIAKQVAETVADVREKMFTTETDGKKFIQDNDGRKYLLVDGKPTLADGSGDPIKTIQDVMGLINPLTVGSEENPEGRGFTEDEAASWLLAAQQKMNENLATMDKQLDEIANVNLDLKDQADSVNENYGELLKKMPELRDQLWAQYEKTLVKDPKTGIITKMPVALESFYDIALTPYIKLAESLEAQAEADKVREAELAKTKKASRRVDRSDIFGDGKTDDLDDEDKEWAQAAKSYYGK